MSATAAARLPATPIRSLVHVGDSEDAIATALEGGADALFLDLEEPRYPYGPQEQGRSREAVRRYLTSAALAGRGPQAFVRVQSPWSGQTMLDLRAVVTPALTGVLLPKTAGPEDVVALDALLGCAEAECGLPMGSIQIAPLLETAQSIRLAYEIAMASPRVTHMGGMVSRLGDVQRAIGYRWTAAGSESHYLRSKVLIDARAAGIEYPISGVWGGAADDLDGMRTWAEQLRGLGYYGMLVASPAGIDVAHEVFTPTAEEIAQWEQLAATGSVDGTSAEDAHQAYVETAQRNLRWARQLRL